MLRPLVLPQPAPIWPARDAHATERILARPLFSPTRRPPLVPSSERIDDAVRLSGIIVSPSGKLAIIQLGTAPRPFVLGEGASVGRWQAQTILADQVTLTDGAQIVTLRTSFTKRVPAAPSVPLGVLRARDEAGRHITPPTFLQRHR